MAACISMSVHGLVDAVTWATKPAFIFWAIFGLLFGLLHYREKDRAAKTRKHPE